MLSFDDPESTNFPDGLLAYVARLLGRVASGVRHVRRHLGPNEEPISLDDLSECAARAARHVNRSRKFLASGRISDAREHVALLAETLRDGVGAARIIEDLGAMTGAAAAGRPHATFSVLETRAIQAAAAAAPLVEWLARKEIPAARPAKRRKPPPRAAKIGERKTQITSTISTGVTTMPKQSQPNTADAVRDIGEMLATVLAGTGTGAAMPGLTVGRRYEAVADQLMASLDAYGLPHDGVQLALREDEAPARARLIDGLRRNFAFKDEDGFRTYFRSAPQPLKRDAVSDSRLLRGATLVNATTVRGAAEAILAAVEQLPDMERFTLAHPRRAEMRDRIQRILDQLIETASDPMGVNVPRGTFLFRRLQAAIIDLIAANGLLPRRSLNQLGLGQRKMEDSFADKHRSTFEQLREDASAVRNEEVRATILALFDLLNRIKEVVTKVSTGMRRGLAAARLEELLSAAYVAAVALEDDLNRAGTSVAEQSLQLFRPTTADGEPDISIGQYLAWTRAVCEPFTGAANDAADLLYNEAGTLADELGRLKTYAEALRDVAPPASTVGLPGVRRQLLELGQLLADAEICAGTIQESDAAASLHFALAPAPERDRDRRIGEDP